MDKKEEKKMSILYIHTEENTDWTGVIICCGIILMILVLWYCLSIIEV